MGGRAFFILFIVWHIAFGTVLMGVRGGYIFALVVAVICGLMCAVDLVRKESAFYSGLLCALIVSEHFVGVHLLR